MKIIGLTGSIGMGKSTVAKMFSELGVKIWDADNSVHNLYKKNGAAVGPLCTEFGDIINEDGDIDREILAKLVLNNPQNLKKLEKIVHPLVGDDRKIFIENSIKSGEKYVIIDVPLLFETNGQKNMDKVIVVDCPADIQKQRVMARPNMTIEKFNSILEKQIPNQQKVALADFVVDTSLSFEQTKDKVVEIHNKLLQI